MTLAAVNDKNWSRSAYRDGGFAEPSGLRSPERISADTFSAEAGHPSASNSPTHPQQSPPQFVERGSASIPRMRPHVLHL